MKAPLVALLVLLSASVASASPVSKVVQMLSDLEAKIIGEGEHAQQVYEEFSEWCEDRSKDLHYEVDTGKAGVAELTAAIDKANADLNALGAKIEELTGEIAKDEADLKAATQIRETEAADFAAEEKDLSETIDVLQRAITILERGSSFLQAKSFASLAEAFQVLVRGSAFNSADVSRLTALLQGSSSEMGDGAPDPAAYKSHSGDIIATCQGLLDKAESQLADARSTETANLHNFEMMRGTLKDEIKFGNKELGEAKTRSAETSDGKATAEGDLDATSKALAASTKALADLHADCMERAETFEAETASRAEELKALATARNVIKEAMNGAEAVAYGLDQVSLLQVDPPRFQALHIVRDLAKTHGSPALTQLARRMSSMMRDSSEDVFGKIKGLIRDMIEKLLDEAAADASHKAYCDKEIGEAKAKKEDLEAEIAKLTSRIDSKSSRSSQLRNEVADLQNQLAELARSQAEMDKIRAQEKAVYDSEKKEMEEGVEGIRLALKILKEYYASDKSHAAAEGAGGGIIGLLEVVESDFSKTLAEINSTEEAATAEYEKTTKENEVLKSTMSQDVKYKTKESMELDTRVAELTEDRNGENTELNAVSDYHNTLNGQCITKAESYSERVGRRDAEIAGLKQALEVLS